VTNTANAAPHFAASLLDYSQAQIYSWAPFPQHPHFIFSYQHDSPTVTPIYMHNRHKYCLYVLILLHFCIANWKILLVNSRSSPKQNRNTLTWAIT